MLDQRALVFESVTLGQVVQFVVQVLVDLAACAVLDEETAEDTETTHPHDVTISPKVSIRLSELPFGHVCISGDISLKDQRLFTYLGILASAVPFLLPKPRCLPILLAAVRARDLARECMVTGLRMMRPSEMSLRTVWRELALEISFTSFGSSQILRLPQPATDAARRF